MKLTLDTKDLDEITNNSGKIALSNSAETGLLVLFEMKAKIDQAIEQAKILIDARASEIDPTWRAIQSDHIKIMKSSVGPRYILSDPEKAGEFIKEVVRTIVDVDKVDQYIEATDKLPVGIALAERKQVVNIKERNAD